MKKKGFIIISLSIFMQFSCFKEIDVVPIELKIESTFVISNNIQKKQTYVTIYENTAVEVATASPAEWDLAFESAGNGSRVMLGWASGALVHKTGKFSIADVTKESILEYINNTSEWHFDDPAYTNYLDSLSLKNWENGEVYVLNRAKTSDNYYAIQFVSKTDKSYTFKYAPATNLANVSTFTVNRSEGLNFVYFSIATKAIVNIEPRKTEWDLVFTPYLGWWETSTPGVFSPYNVSGILINYEAGVRVAQVFDPTISFESLDDNYIATANFTDWKGVIGSNWKLLGAVGSANLYTMDPKKKYLLKKFDVYTAKFQYYKMRIVDYKLNNEDHHPTVEFKLLKEE